MNSVLIVGAGNFLLSDEGFGVHFIAYLQKRFRFPSEIALFDAGTMGILISHELEQAECLYVVDTLIGVGSPGAWTRFAREDILLNRIPVTLSPHQAGLQEALMVSDLRGRCPEEIHLFGILPASLDPGTCLSPELERRLPELADLLVGELRNRGHQITPRG